MALSASLCLHVGWGFGVLQILDSKHSEVFRKVMLSGGFCCTLPNGMAQCFRARYLTCQLVMDIWTKRNIFKH